MVKLIVLYGKPDDVAGFEKHYREVHLPLARKMPGLKKCELCWVRGSPGGEARYHLVAELYFEDRAALKSALASPEGGAAGKDLMGFAGRIVHMMITEVETA